MALFAYVETHMALSLVTVLISKEDKQQSQYNWASSPANTLFCKFPQRG